MKFEADKDDEGNFKPATVNYEEYENDIYAAYQSTFESQEFSWGEKPIRQKKHPMFKGKSGTFWHIISSGDSEESRIPDFRRYERVTWPAYILSYCKDNCDKILVWKNQRKNKTRILLWCQDIDYLVVLDERKDFCLFWTAYPTTYSHTKEKLMKEYTEYWKKQDK